MKKIISIILSISIVVVSLLNVTYSKANEKRNQLFKGLNYDVEFSVDCSWEGGYIGTITIINTGKSIINDWNIRIPMNGEKISNIWNAKMTEEAGNNCVFENVGYNKKIAPDDKISFGFMVNESFSKFPDYFELLDNQEIILKDSYSVEYKIDKCWKNGFLGKLIINNLLNDTLKNWRLDVCFANDISSIWNGKIEKINNREYIFTGEDYNCDIKAGESVEIGFICSTTNYAAKIEPVKFTYTSIRSRAGKEEITENIYEIMNNCYIEYANGDSNKCVTRDINFVVPEKYKKYVSWQISDSNIINYDGKIKRKNVDNNVKIKKIIIYHGEKIEKNIDITIKGKCLYSVSQLKDYSINEIEKMNSDNKDYDVEIGSLGYVQEIYGRYSDVSVDSWETALYSLYNVQTALGINDPFTELYPMSCNEDQNGYTFSFKQIHCGLDVFDRGVTISCDIDGVTTMLSSSYLPITSLIESAPSLSPLEGEKIIKKEFDGVVRSIQENPKLYMIKLIDRETIGWAYNVIVCENEERYNNYLVIVDANNSKVLGYYCLTNYSQGCKCLGYDITNSKREFIGTKEASDRYIMVDPVRKLDVREIKGENIYTRIVSSTKSDRDWDKNSVSLMANAQEVYDYYKDLEGFHRRGFDGKRNSMKMGINKDVTNNAEWINGENLLVCGIGDGAKMYQNDKQNGYFFRFKEGVAIASLDIVAHEYTHAHFANISDGRILAYSCGIPQAISEAYSDILACFIDGNWTIGEDVVKEKCMRNIKNPNISGNPQKIWDEYYDYSEIVSGKKVENVDGHNNSTVLSHAAYLMYDRLSQLGDGIDYKKQLASVWASSMYTYGGIENDFYTVRQKIMQAKKYPKLKSKKKMQIIRDSFNECNITKAICDKDYKYFSKLNRSGGIFASALNNEVNYYGKVVVADSDNNIGNNKPLNDVRVNMYFEDQGVGNAKTQTNGYYKFAVNDFSECRLNLKKNNYLSEDMYVGNEYEGIRNNVYCDTVELIPQELNGMGRQAAIYKMQ